VLVEESVATTEYLSFNAGTHQDVIRMSFNDFPDLVNRLIVTFAMAIPAAVQ